MPRSETQIPSLAWGRIASKSTDEDALGATQNQGTKKAAWRMLRAAFRICYGAIAK